MSWRKLIAKSRRQGTALPTEPAPDAIADREACACENQRLQAAAEIVSDNREIAALHIIREIFAGFCTGRVEHWNFACDQAGDAMGEDGGTILFAHVLSVARAIKSDRIGTFYFQNSGCSRITEDEALAIRMVQAGRRNDPFELARLADAMAQGGASLRIHYASYRLGILIEASGRTLATIRDLTVPDESRSTLH